MMIRKMVAMDLIREKQDSTSGARNVRKPTRGTVPIVTSVERATISGKTVQKINKRRSGGG